MRSGKYRITPLLHKTDSSSEMTTPASNTPVAYETSIAMLLAEMETDACSIAKKEFATSPTTKKE